MSERKTKHLIFRPNGKAGICDHCLQFADSRYDFHVNGKRTEKRCAPCVAKGAGASMTILEEKV